MTSVTRCPGESLESLIRRFNREVKTDGVLWQINETRHYRKPSKIERDKRHRKLAKSRSSTRLYLETLHDITR